MSEEIQKLKFVVDTKSLDEANIKLQQEKEKVQELNKAIKDLGKESGARKDIIIEKAQAEKNIKDIRSQIKELEKGTVQSTSISAKSFLKMGLAMTGVLGIGRGLSEVLKKLFKESEAFKQLALRFDDMGKALSRMIDKAILPFMKGVKSIKDIELEKTLDKVRDSAIKNVASFEVLAREVENLGNKINPTTSEQLRYSEAVDKLKKQYPEYLTMLSSEISNHKENIGLLQTKREMLYQEIENKVYYEELEIAIRDAVKAEKAYTAAKKDNLISFEEYGKILDTHMEAQTKVDRVTEKYNKRIEEQSKANEELAEKLKIIREQEEEATKAKQQETKAIEEEENRLNSLVKKYEDARIEAIKKEKIDTDRLDTDKLIKTSIEELTVANNALNESMGVTVNTAVSGSEALSSFWGKAIEKKEDLEAMTYIAGQSVQVFSNLLQVESNNIESKYAREADLIKEQFANKKMSQEEYDKAMVKLELKKEKETAKLRKKQKAAAMAEAAINTANGIINALTMKPVWAVPWAIALATLTGATQMGVIASQKFQEGGLAVGPSHSEGGIPGTVKGRPIEFEGGEIIAKKEVNEDPYTRDIVNYAQVLKKGRRIPNSRNVKGIMIDYGSRQHYLTGSGRGLPSLSSMTFAEGGSTGAISPTSSSVASPITVNIPQSKTELIPIMKGNDLFIKVTQMQNEYKRANGDLDTI